MTGIVKGEILSRELVDQRIERLENNFEENEIIKSLLPFIKDDGTKAVLEYDRGHFMLLEVVDKKSVLSSPTSLKLFMILERLQNGTYTPTDIAFHLYK